MSHLASGSLVRQIESLFDGGSVTGLSDRQLLERFTTRRDDAGEVAFAALVARHGPMVLVVCQDLLGDRHHAEDAFQAVFLVLARKAGSIREPDLLGNWLYGVALRTARCARLRLARRRRNEEALSTSPTDPAVPADRPVLAREQAEALHVEIDRLPDAFRLPLVLCYFEGLTVHEAARRLRCSHGTVRSRIARARDKLRRGLTRRGVVLPAAALTAVFDSKDASASVSSPLCDITTRAALKFAAGQAATPSAAALAREVLRSMLIRKLKLTALALLFLGTVATGAGYLTPAPAMKDEPKKAPVGASSKVAAKTDDATPKPPLGRMFVVGRVLDPQGKPVPGATIMVHARNLTPGRPSIHFPSSAKLVPLGDARADGSGRFRIDTPRTSSSHHEDFGAVAIAPGYGAGWVALDPDDDQPAAEISLRPEQVIHGRLFDVQGRPVPDVRVSVRWIDSELPLARARAGLQNRSVLRRDGVSYWARDAHDYPAWPRPTTTDSEGRFTVRGVGQNLHAALTVHHPRFAHQTIKIDTDDDEESKTVTAALTAPQIVNVRVTYADTGQPVPHAPLRVIADQGAITRFDESETDADGRARINSYQTETGYYIMAFPPEGQPYLVASGRVGWPRGALEQTLNISLQRGVLVQGRVTEEGSGKPVPGALVDFTMRQGLGRQDSIMSVHTDSDGSFRLGAQPAPGHLFVRGPDDTYVFQAIGSRVVREGQPGGYRSYSHAYAALDLKPGMGSREVNLVLRRGATVEGRVVGPDGQPVRDAWIFSRLILDPNGDAARDWTELYHGKVSNGAFAIRGLALDAEVPVYFLEPKRKLGAVVNLSVKSAAGGPVTVRLEPCGDARAWLVGPDGKPVARPVRNLSITMVVTPGAARTSLSNDKAGSLLFADEGGLTNIDPINYETAPAPDALGRISAPRPDPGSDLSLHRSHHVRPRPDRPGDPQGIHHRAGPETQPGRYPGREAARFVGRAATRSLAPGPTGIECPRSGQSFTGDGREHRLCDGARGHDQRDDIIGGPADRVALRRRLRRRIIRSPAPRAVRRPPRSDRRGRVRRAGGSARADGAGRLPATPGRPASRRGRLPGRLPGPGPQGRLVARPRPAGKLALRGGPPHGSQGQGPARSSATQRRRRGHDRRGQRDDSRADGPAGRSAGDRSRTGRGAPRRDRPPAGRLPPAGRALLLRGPHARRGGASAPLSGRDASQSDRPGAG